METFTTILSIIILIGLSLVVIRQQFKISSQNRTIHHKNALVRVLRYRLGDNQDNSENEPETVKSFYLNLQNEYEMSKRKNKIYSEKIDSLNTIVTEHQNEIIRISKLLNDQQTCVTSNDSQQTENRLIKLIIDYSYKQYDPPKNKMLNRSIICTFSDLSQISNKRINEGILKKTGLAEITINNIKQIQSYE